VHTCSESPSSLAAVARLHNLDGGESLCTRDPSEGQDPTEEIQQKDMHCNVDAPIRFVETQSQGPPAYGFVTVIRKRLREVAGGQGAHHLANLGGCPAR
jgi:hypothetical protein